MRFVVALTMLVASLLYATLPARAEMAMHGPMQVTMDDMGDMAQAPRHDPQADAVSASSADDCCPHGGSSPHGSSAPHGCFCAACLAVLPEPAAAKAARDAASRTASVPVRALVSLAPAPADPPPRS